MSEAGTLRAMVRNYRMNNLWDHLDAEACTKAANKIDELTKQRDELIDALEMVFSENKYRDFLTSHENKTVFKALAKAKGGAA